MHAVGYRNTWAEISLDAIEHNTRWFLGQLAGSTRMMAVVKADGYGHGAVEVARAAIGAGAGMLGVAFLDEAVQLREDGITSPILLLGYTPPQSVEAAIRHNVTLTVFTDDVIKEIIECAERLKRQARIHLKIDTGMSRVGVTSEEEALSLAMKAKASSYVVVEGIFTHFADADNEDATFTELQFERFMQVIRSLDEQGITFPIRHCCNSAGTLRYPHMHIDMVRVGISLYGLSPSPAMSVRVKPLRQAMQFRTRVAALKRLSPNTPIGYGCTYTTERDSLIATIPVGYADGLPRLLSNRGCALIRGRKVPLVGNVCMDQVMLDVTDVPDIEPGEEVVLFGQSAGKVLSADDLAALTGTIGYEIVCQVGKRVPRLYTNAGTYVSGRNELLRISDSFAHA